ncbi:MAG: hypothetical protein JNM94_16045 [Phycisphaerae bacterium]|nr:hypothetical protein [Phycisphaerae bacterium]
MSTQPLDLRPEGVRARVERRRSFAHAARIGIALALATAVGVAASEVVRDDSAQRLARARAAADRTTDLRGLVNRTNTEVARAVRLFADSKRLPLERVFALVGGELSSDLTLESFRAAEGESSCTLELVFDGAPDALMANLAAKAPWLVVEPIDSGVRLVVPRDVPFDVVDADPTGEATDAR